MTERVEALRAELRVKLEERARYFEQERLKFDWSKRGRPKQQLPDGEWSVLFISAGRGFGKTEAGAQAIRKWAMTGQGRRMAILGSTAADVRDVMVEGS